MLRVAVGSKDRHHYQTILISFPSSSQWFLSFHSFLFIFGLIKRTTTLLRRPRTTSLVVNNEKFLWLREKKEDSKIRNKWCRGRGKKVEAERMKKNKAKYLHSIQLSNGTRCKTLQSFDNFALRSEFSFEFLPFRCRIIWNCRNTHTQTHMGASTKLYKSVGATKTSLLTASFICRG